MITAQQMKARADKAKREDKWNRLIKMIESKASDGKYSIDLESTFFLSQHELDKLNDAGFETTTILHPTFGPLAKEDHWQISWGVKEVSAELGEKFNGNALHDYVYGDSGTSAAVNAILNRQDKLFSDAESALGKYFRAKGRELSKQQVEALSSQNIPNLWPESLGAIVGTHIGIVEENRPIKLANHLNEFVESGHDLTLDKGLITLIRRVVRKLNPNA